jgi:hypothetical protein
MKVQRMNIKKKEVVVTPFEDNPIWKLFRTPRSSSVDSTPTTRSTRGTGGTSQEDEDELRPPSGEAESKIQHISIDQVPSLTLSLLESDPEESA